MPRPGTIEPRAGADAPHGATADLQRLAKAAPTRSAPSTPAPAPAARPTTVPSPETQLPGTDLNNGFDEYLFAPTARDAEPLTEGAPWGPGANFVPRRMETSRDFLNRVADELSVAPGAGPQVQRLVERIRRGE